MPEDESAVAASPCAACRTLRRRCVPGCIFASYFPAEGDEPSRWFAAVHRVFGASNAARMLADVDLPDDRRRAAETLVEEAMARVRDPAFGFVSLHAILLMLNQEAREQLDSVREEIAREFGDDAASLPVDVDAAASPEVMMAAKEMVERALADARKKDAELFDGRRAVDLEWQQQQCSQAAKRAAGEGRHSVLAAAGESSSEKTMMTPQAAAAGDEHRHLAAVHAGAEPGIPEGYKQSAAEEEAAKTEEEEALASEQAMAADELQSHDSAATELGREGTSSYLDVAAAEELAKKLDAMINDPASARYASLGVDVMPGLQQPPQARDMAQEEAAAAVEAASDQGLRMMLTQQIDAEAAEAAEQQGMAIHLLAKQYDVNDTQLVAAAFAAEEVSGNQCMTMPHAAAAAELVRQEMMMQYAQTELDINLGLSQEIIVQQLASAAAAPLAMEQDTIMPEVAAAAELASEEALIIHNVATAELAREQQALMMQQTEQQEEEMTLLLEAAAALQRPVPVAQQLAGAVQVAMEPNTTIQLPRSGEATPFLVGQQPPLEGQTTATAGLGLQLDSSLLPLLGQTQTSAQVPQQQQSSDGGDEEQDSDLTSLFYYRSVSRHASASVSAGSKEHEDEMRHYQKR